MRIAWRWVKWVLVCAVGAPLGAMASPPNPTHAAWFSAWLAAADSAGPPLPAQTLRQTLRPALGGSAVRLRISNEYGDRALQVDAATVALAATGAGIQPTSARPLTVQGRRHFRIAAGQFVWTDPTPMPVAAHQPLSVSLFFAKPTGASTIHSVGLQNAYSHWRGDATRAASLRIDATDDSRYFVTDLEVLAAPDTEVIVAVGDSTTDGVGIDLDSDLRWTDQLNARLQHEPALRHVVAVNAGLAGNRILHDGRDPFLGPSTLKRLDRDALSKRGVKWLVLLQGINDITANTVFANLASEQVTAEQLIAGMQQIIQRAHAHGVRVLGATLLPRDGAQGGRAHNAAGETMRQQVNAWIRTAGAFDAVVDFDAAVRDPARPERQRPDLNSGDFSHPNAAGYAAMARAIDLERLKP